MVVYDDASSDDYTEVARYLQSHGWSYEKLPKNHGKENLWKLFDHIFQKTRAVDAQYYLQLQDDYLLCDDFFVRVLQTWEGIEDEQKIALNPLKDSRSAPGITCWTPLGPEWVSDTIIRTGWIDGAFLCERRFFEELDWKMAPVDASRWRWNKDLSSGVGEQMSIRLYDKELGMYLAGQSLVVNAALPSLLNPRERKRTSLSAVDYIDGDGRAKRLALGEEVTASLASIPGRAATLKNVIRRLLPQVDRLNVYLNGYADVPTFLHHPKIEFARSQDHGDRGDAGKFFWSDDATGFYLTCDDDILYPPDYVEMLVLVIEECHRQAAVSFHGAVLPESISDYYGSRLAYHCLADVNEDVPVHVLGTGVLGYHTSTIEVTGEDFKIPNMADIWFGILGQEQGVPFVCAAHEKEWLVDGSPAGEESIYSSSRGNSSGAMNTGREQTRVVRQHAPWKINTMAPQRTDGRTDHGGLPGAGLEKRLAVVVPYRNRLSHLIEMLPALERSLKEHHPDLSYRVFVVEQAEDGKPFNRGMMKNIGFCIAGERGYEYCAFHDVDMLPVDEQCDYSYVDRPTRLASRFVGEPGGTTTSAWRFFFGGVVLLNIDDFARVNGYSNEYRGWGAEDEDLRYRCTSSGLEIKHRMGTYLTLKHPSHRKKDGDLPRVNKERLDQVRAGMIDTSRDGLSSLEYRTTREEELPHHGLKVTVEV